ncbi:phosphomannomutase/phosphoglucomutase [Caldinitratiruptor microaerophilus]|nr:phosphomannomutase/phosphoglucomutase [Caldinitratiruptor microaerophilus]
MFREYDIRGVAGDDLTPAVAEAVGRAFATYMQRRGVRDRRVLVGRDGRASSPELREALVAGLRSAGADVVDIGLVVTPILYYSRVLYGIDGAVMITASHNPPEYNGFKIALGYATIHGEEIQALRRIIEEESFAAGSGSYETRDPVPEYIEMLREKIRLDRPLKVVADAGNGTAGLFAEKALRAMGAEVIPLYCDLDPSFPHHHPDPVKPENLQDLIRAVREHGADLGLGFDGDADRLGVVDDGGGIVWGDTYMALLWREVLARHPGAPAIIEVKCSQALWDEVERLGGRPLFYRTGHSLIKAKMKEIGAVFTGEMSGHMFFADEYYGYDDAFYAAGRLLRFLSRQPKPLSALVAEIPHYHATPEIRVDCPDERKFEVVAALREHFKRQYEVVEVDGARVLFPGGWGLVRASNTQPVLVLRCEGRTEADLERIKDEMEQALREVGGIRCEL